MKPWIVVIMFAVLGCGVYLLHATSDAAPPPAVSIAPGARASSRAAGPAPLVATRPAHLEPAIPVEDNRSGAAGPPANEDPAGPGPVTPEDMRNQLETSFTAAPAAASRDLAQSLDSGLRAVLPVGSSIRSVECRGSLCRVETVHPGVDEFRGFVQHAFQDFPRAANGPVYVSLLEEPTPGKPVVAVVYVGREGTVLPVPGAVAAR